MKEQKKQSNLKKEDGGDENDNSNMKEKEKQLEKVEEAILTRGVEKKLRDQEIENLAKRERERQEEIREENLKKLVEKE